MLSVHSNLIVSILSNVAYPWQCLIATLFNNFEITNLNTTDCEVRYFKFYLNRNFLVVFTFLIFNRRKSKLSSHHKFFPSWKLLDNPNHARLIWYIFHCSNICFEWRWVNIDWNWNNNLYVIGYRLLFKLRFSLYNELNFCFCARSNGCFYPN